MKYFQIIIVCLILLTASCLFAEDKLGNNPTPQKTSTSKPVEEEPLDVDALLKDIEAKNKALDEKIKKLNEQTAEHQKNADENKRKADEHAKATELMRQSYKEITGKELKETNEPNK